MQLVPLQAAPSQNLSVTLGGQACALNVYSKLGIIYADVFLNNSPVILGVQCENGNRIVRSLYLGFSGDLIFVDTQGQADPTYTGLGSRFQLVYLSTDDLATLGFQA